MKNLPGVVLVALLLGGCEAPEPAPVDFDYDIMTRGTREFAWDTATAPGVIKVLIEERNLGTAGAEVAEIFFPPGFHGATHPHELEILYVLEGELDHIVNGESHILKPGMVGIVREPDLVVHRAVSDGGVRVLVIWPLGGEVAGFEASGMRENDITETAAIGENDE